MQRPRAEALEDYDEDGNDFPNVALLQSVLSDPTYRADVKRRVFVGEKHPKMLTEDDRAILREEEATFYEDTTSDTATAGIDNKDASDELMATTEANSVPPVIQFNTPVASPSKVDTPKRKSAKRVSWADQVQGATVKDLEVFVRQRRDGFQERHLQHYLDDVKKQVHDYPGCFVYEKWNKNCTTKYCNLNVKFPLTLPKPPFEFHDWPTVDSGGQREFKRRRKEDGAATRLFDKLRSTAEVRKVGKIALESQHCVGAVPHDYFILEIPSRDVLRGLGGMIHRCRVGFV